MRFLARGLFGLCLLTLTLALLGLAANTFVQSLNEKAENSHRPRTAKERVFTVEVRPIVLVDHAPIITTFGEVVSGQTLELRAAAGGALVKLSPNFREGGQVKKGALLFQTDPSNAMSKLLLAETELSEAKSDLIDARSDYTLAEAEIEAAKTQLNLRHQAMARQKSLKDRGLGTEAAMEVAALSASSADQALLSKELLRSQARSRIARADAIAGRNLVQARAPQLGEGIRIEPRQAGVPLQEPAIEKETVEVSDELREQMIAFVTASKRIPADRKRKVLEDLQKPKLPKAMVERITSRMGG